MWGLKVTGISAALGEEVLVALTSFSIKGTNN